MTKIRCLNQIKNKYNDRFVLAAHCFFDGDVTSDSRTRLLESENAYKIAVGKYDRNISILDNDFTQIIDVCDKF